MAIYMTAWFATLTLASDPKYSKMCWSKSWGIFAPFKTLPILVGDLNTPPFLAKGTHALQTPIFPKGTFFRDHPNCWPWKESQIGSDAKKGTFQGSWWLCSPHILSGMILLFDCWFDITFQSPGTKTWCKDRKSFSSICNGNVTFLPGIFSTSSATRDVLPVISHGKGLGCPVGS